MAKKTAKRSTKKVSRSGSARGGSGRGGAGARNTTKKSVKKKTTKKSAAKRGGGVRMSARNVVAKAKRAVRESKAPRRVRQIALQVGEKLNTAAETATRVIATTAGAVAGTVQSLRPGETRPEESSETENA